jgi:asparagine synthase (glutamine-hydrolysing)
MCGIAGISGSWKREHHLSWLEAMKKAMLHRGNDDEGMVQLDDCSLGHQRLSIIDTSKDGHQPMSDPTDRVTVVYNGEIYNFIELRQLLKGAFEFKTESDTEVLIAAYLKWGKEFVQYLNGMFSIAIYDNNTGELLLVRDRLGEKPLYYFEKNETLFFASEMRSLLATGESSAVVDQTALIQYVTYQTVWNPLTIVEGIFSLMPGEMRVWKEGSWQMKKRYWDVQEIPSSNELRSKEEVVKEVRSHLERSVQWRMRCDVSFGAFLSGGVDSSAVVGLMSQFSTQAISTFSIGFDDPQFDESEFAQIVASRYNTQHHPIKLTANDFFDAVIPALNAMDHPSGDGVNSYVVAQVTAAQGIKMALSGSGGDEVFGGYPIFHRMLQSRTIRNWIPPISFRGPVLETLLSKKWNKVQVNRLLPLLRAKRRTDALIFTADRMMVDTDLLQDFVKDSSQVWLPENYWKTHDETHLYQSISSAEMNAYMSHILLRDADQMSMAHTLEVRVPLIDHELVEFVVALPDEYKMGQYDKNLLIQATKDLIPESTYKRKKKGFVFPWESWMKGPLRSFCEQELLQLKDLPIFEAIGLEENWNRFVQGDKRIPWNYFWHLVVLSHWIKKNNVRFS